jgi:hypothetical protein
MRRNGKRNVSTLSIGITPIVSGAPGSMSDAPGDNFRGTPASDRGNATYTDRGQLGSYAPTNEPYRPTADVQFGSGYGCTEDDAHRGYADVSIRDVPEYGFDNYRDRWTMPKERAVDDSEDWPGQSDMDFRMRSLRSRGFLTR